MEIINNNKTETLLEEFLITTDSLKELNNYYLVNGLRKFADYKTWKNEYVYVITFRRTGKKYIGKSTNICDRLDDYLKLTNINSDLKDDLIYNGYSEFSYKLIRTNNCVVVEKEMIEDCVKNNIPIYNKQIKLKKEENKIIPKPHTKNKEPNFKGFNI